MKLAALIPFRNEAHVLPLSVGALSSVCDVVLGVDDRSTDGSADVFRDCGGTLVPMLGGSTAWQSGGQARARASLLCAARAKGATYHLWIDADEVASERFLSQADVWLSRLEPGAKLLLPWVNLLHEYNEYVSGHHILAPQYKDFIAYDDASFEYDKGVLHFSRTPGPRSGADVAVPFDDGAILHLQYLWPNRLRAKQAWYRVLERKLTSRSPRRINRRYGHTGDALEKAPTRKLNETHLAPSQARLVSSIADEQDPWQVGEILEMFDEDGSAWFEGLDIWDIPALKRRFLADHGREPNPSTPSRLVTRLASDRRSYRLREVVRGLARVRDEGS